MNEGLKRFLLTLMMLVLPVQAFASVALLGCEFTRAASEAMPMAESAGMGQDMAGCHEAPANPSGMPAADPPCSHCAACHLAAAFPFPISATAPETPIPYAPHLLRAEPFSGFIPEGPERPPRTPSV